MGSRGRLLVLIAALVTVFVYKDLIFRPPSSQGTRAGIRLPDVRLTTLSEDTLTLSELIRKTGSEPKVVLVLWATWCEPCVRELPVIEETLPGFHDSGMQIHLVNYDGPLPSKTLPEVRAWLTSQKVGLPTYFEFGEGLVDKLGIPGLPFVIGLDRDLKIQWTQLGEMDWTRKDDVLNRFKP